MRLFSLFVCSLVLVACVPNRPSEVEVAPPPPAPPKSAAPTSAPADVRTLTLEADALRVDGDHVVFEPNSRMQRADYDRYRFEKSAFQAKVGTLTPKEPLRVTVEVLSVKVERYTPSDPHMPAPMGGFETRTYECRVVRVEP
jgi:hypothetical protein